MNILIIILARGGSKRLKNKNIIKLGNKPLITRTIDFAKKINCENILLSTDNKKIMSVAKKSKILIPWTRPRYLATDNIPPVFAAIHALNWYEKKINKVEGVLLLQPTTPFRNYRHIKKALKAFKKNPKKNFIAVSKFNGNLNKIFFYKKKKEIKIINKNLELKLKKFNFFQPNGSFYLISSSELKKTKSFITKNSKGILINKKKEMIDIDTLEDYKYAKTFIKKNKNI